MSLSFSLRRTASRVSLSAAVVVLSIGLQVAQPTHAQDGKPPASDTAKEPTKQPRVRPRPEEPPATDTKSVVTTKAELGSDTAATGEELGKLLEVHGVTCGSCEGEVCSDCKMAPLPEGAERDGRHHEHPHGADPHGADPHGADPHGADPHGADPHGANPHHGKHGGFAGHGKAAHKAHFKKMRHALKGAQKSVVRVVNARERGTGFLFGSKRHVITALEVVESGRATYVVDHNGAEIGAKIVGTDRGAGLALLELDAELSGAEPLRSVHEKRDGKHHDHGKQGEPHIGPALVIGNHYGAGQRWGVDLNKLTNGVVRPVAISSTDGDALLLGSAVPDTFIGAPVIAPNGRLLGVVRWAKKERHSSIATSAHRVDGFYKAQTERNADAYNGRIRLRWGGGILLFAGNQSTFGGGLQMSTSIDFFDRFGMTARLAYGLGLQDRADAERPSAILSRTYGRFIVDGVAYYRFMMPGFYGKQTPISIGVGGAYVNDNGEDRVLVDGNFVTEDFSYDRGMLEADLQIGWLRGSFFIRPDDTEDWFFTLSASMQY